MILKLKKNHCYRNPISIDDVDIDKILIFKNISFGKKNFKYFVSYKHDKKVQTLYITLTNMSGYTKTF